MSSTVAESNQAYTQLVLDIVAESKKGKIKDFISTVDKIMADRERDMRQALLSAATQESEKTKKKTTAPAPEPTDESGVALAQQINRGRPNWQAYWTSKEYGCRAYSPLKADLSEIEKSAPNGKANRFTVNQELRRRAEATGRFSQWKTWATEKLKRDGKALPSSVK